MQRNQIFTIIILLISYGRCQDKPQIFSISNVIDRDNYQRISSLSGGTLLYIKGVGFSTMTHDNMVMIGNNPCVVQASSNYYIQCVTTKNAQEQQLLLTVSVSGVKAICAVWDCFVYYQYYNTGRINYVLPGASPPNSLAGFSGLLQVSMTSDIQFIKLGQFQCNLRDKTASRVNYWDQSSLVQCTTSPDLSAGIYSTQFSAPNGDLLNEYSSQRYDLNSNIHQFKILPIITQVSSNLGSILGQKLTISGAGFSNFKDQIKVTSGGQLCEITAQNLNQINCTVQANYMNNNLQAFDTYVGHSGVTVKVYNITNNSFDANINDARSASPVNSLAYQTITYDFEIGLNSGQYKKLYHLRSLFKCNITGPHTFRMNANPMYARVYLSNVTNSTDSANLQMILNATNYIDTNKGFRKMYWYSNDPDAIIASAPITLTAGQYYLMEGFYQNYYNWDSSSFTVQVETPSFNGQTFNNSQSEAQLISVYYTHKQEQMYIRIMNTNNGTFKLIMNGYETQQINWNTDKNTLAYCLNYQLNAYGDAQVLVLALDSTGQFTNSTNSSLIYGYQYNITFGQHRLSNAGMKPMIQHQLTPLPGLSVQASLAITQAPDNILTGNYTLTYNSQSVIIQSNANADNFRQQLQKVVQDLSVSVEMFGNAIENHQYLVSFNKIKGEQPLFTFDKTNLTCDNKSSISVTSERNRTASNTTLIFNPISTEYLSTVVQKRQTIVTVNNIKASCQQGTICDYETDSTKVPKITQYTFNTNQLTISITTVTGLNIDSSRLEVMFGEAACQVNVLTTTNSSISCVIPANTDGSLQTVAGSHIPIVNYFGLGQFEYQSSVTPTQISPTVSSISQQNGYSQGGQQIDLLGTNFPFTPNTNGSNSLTVTMGGVSCKILSYSNQKITILTAAGSGSVTIQVTINSKQATIQYSYSSDPPSTITSIDKTSASPSLVTYINLVGTNFDTDLTNVYAQLVSISKPNVFYPLSIVTSTATSMQVIVNGGVQDNYYFQIINGIKGKYAVNINGASTPIVFQYKFIVSSISPSTGSQLGGTLLVITGENFSSTLSQMQVFVGDNNVICDVQSTSATQLTCLTRESTVSAKMNVTVTQRIQDIAVCSDTVNYCNFQYDKTLTAQITQSPGPMIVQYNQPVNFTGTGFNAQTVMFLQGQSTGIALNVSQQASSSNSTFINFLMPSLPKDYYTVNINVPGKGYSNFTSGSAPILINNPIILNVSPLSGSYGGNNLTITGSGFDSNTKIIGFFQNTQTNCEIITQSYSQITCRMFSFSTTNQLSQEIVLTYNGEMQTQTTKFYYVNTVTDTVIVTSVNDQQTQQQITLSSNTFSVSLGGTSGIDRISSVQLYSMKNKQIFQGTILAGQSTTRVTVSFINVPLDNYIINAMTSTGYAYFNNQLDQIKVGIQSPSVDSSSQIQSYVGGLLTLNGNGFDYNNIYNNLITVCGYYCQPKQSTYSQFQCILQGINNQYINDNYMKKSPETIQPLTISSDYNFDTLRNLTNNQLGDFYQGLNNKIVFDFGQNMIANISQIGIFPTMNQNITRLEDTIIEGSNDNITFTTIKQYSASQIQPGWNNWISDRYQNNVLYRFIRISLNSQNTKKFISEVQFQGLIFYQKDIFNLASTSCDVSVTTNGFQQSIISNGIQLRQDATPIISSITPNKGSTAGNYNIQISGSGFKTIVSNVKVWIDNINCSVQSVTDVLITCTVGARPVFTIPSLQVFIGQTLAANLGNRFTYIDRWSDKNTWGGMSPPRQGDSVYIPAGQNVLLDISPPQLYTVMVQGQLIFDNVNINLQAYYIVSNGGNITIGTETNRITSNITIVLLGDRNGAQLPMYGNKGLIMNNGVLDIHGAYRNKTWTTLSETAAAGTNVLKLTDPVDWKVGELLGIASSTYSYNNSECLRIKQVIDSKTIVLNDSLAFNHYSAIETFDGKQVRLMTEVGLLSRNIKIMGGPGSWESGYGGHLMIHGKQSDGTIARISYAEFTNMGQQQIIGRYSIHFHICGIMYQSYVEGNAVHHSLARVITLHQTDYVKVRKNVGYFVYGHNYFLETGSESYNTLEENLSIKAVQISTLLVSDQTASNFWITRPLNYIVNNVAAGGDWYGYWYEIMEHPQDSSMNPNICPQGEQILQFSGNIAHSMTKYGLRINSIVSKTNPCWRSRIDFYNGIAQEPTSMNPPVLSIFKDFLAFNCRDNGVQAENVGYTLFTNLTLVQNRLSGIIIFKTNDTSPAFPAQVTNSLIVGYSNGNDLSNTSFYQDQRQSGIVTPKTDEIIYSGITFVNFDKNNTQCIETCALCFGDPQTQGGHTSNFQNIKYVGTIYRYINFFNLLNDIIHDLDGSFSLTNKESYITPYKNHHNGVPNCNQVTDKYNVPAIICDNSVQIRPVQFYGMQTEIINAGLLEIARIDSITQQNMTTLNQTTQIYFQKRVGAMMGIKESWVTAMITKQTYQIVFTYGLDFDRLAIIQGYQWQKSDYGIVLRFNTTKTRYSFKSMILYGSNVNQTYFSTNTSVNNNPNYVNMVNGLLNYDNDTKILDINLSGSQNCTGIQILPQPCQYNCPGVSLGCEIETTQRLWSDPSNWPNNVLPKANDDVVILCPWNMTLDLAQTPIFNSITIKGILNFDSSKSLIQLNSKTIYVSTGKLLAGTQSAPYLNTIQIQLYGGVYDQALLIDNYVNVQNKVLVTTGEVSLYGNAPNIVMTKLKVYADSGSTQITVTDQVDWSVNQTIVITSTGYSYYEQEYVQIVSVQGNVIQLNKALKYDHYGDDSKVSSNNGDMDMRATVAVMDRNIQIIGVQNDGELGAQLLVAGSKIMNAATQQFIMQVGWTNIYGVQFINGGQDMTNNSAINFQYTNINGTNNQSLIYKSTFSNSKGMCIFIGNSMNITVDSNVFTGCRKYGVAAYWNTNYIKINNNLFTDIIMRPKIKQATYDYVAGISLEVAQNNFIVQVHNNTAQGIEGVGFIMAGVQCQDQNRTYMFNNTAGSSEGGLVPMNNGTSACYTFGNQFYAYRCDVGVICQFLTESLIADKLSLAENNLNMKIQFAHGFSWDIQQKYTNIHIKALARQNCTKCYNKWQCSNLIGNNPAIHQVAPRMLSTMASVKGIQQICTNQMRDTRTIVNNLVYENFKKTYTETAWKDCSNNVMIQQETAAFDSYSQFYMTNSKMINSDMSSVIRYVNPDPSTAGWLGGCGVIGPCQGVEVFVISDLDGQFFGVPSQTLHKNRVDLTTNYQCEYQNSWSGYYCLGLNYRNLKFENIGSDAFIVMYNPQIQSQMANSMYKFNMFKEWVWNGPIPLDKRPPVFVGQISINTRQNLTFNSAVPPTASFSLQYFPRQNPNKLDYTIISMKFDDPTVVQVKANGTVIAPNVLSQKINLETQSQICGSYNYNTTSRQLEFVLTMECIVTYQKLSSVAVSMQLQVNVNDFYANNGVSNFVDKMCAFLGIPANRLIVVNIRSGSVFVDFHVTASNSSDTATVANQQADLQGISSRIQAGYSSGSMNVGYPIMALTQQIIVQPPVQTTANNTTTPITDNNNKNNINQISSSTNTTLIIIISVLLPLLFIIIVIYLVLRARNQMVEKVKVSPENVNNDDQFEDKDFVDSNNANPENIFNQNLSSNKPQSQQQEQQIQNINSSQNKQNIIQKRASIIQNITSLFKKKSIQEYTIDVNENSKVEYKNNDTFNQRLQDQKPAFISEKNFEHENHQQQEQQFQESQNEQFKSQVKLLKADEVLEVNLEDQNQVNQNEFKNPHRKIKKASNNYV